MYCTAPVRGAVKERRLAVQGVPASVVMFQHASQCNHGTQFFTSQHWLKPVEQVVKVTAICICNKP